MDFRHLGSQTSEIYKTEFIRIFLLERFENLIKIYRKIKMYLKLNLILN